MNKLVPSLSIALGLQLLASAARADGFVGWVYANPTTQVLLSTPTITPFDDGSALVVGDYMKKGLAQEHSAVTMEWTFLNGPLSPRVRHAAVALPGGKVLLCGGAEFEPTQWYTLFAQPEIYDHASRTFTKTGEMITPRIQPAAALSCDDRTEPVVLVTGGGDKWPDLGQDENPKDEGHGIILDTAEIYRLSTGQWESVPSMSTPRFLHTATCIPGHGVLVVGGRVASFIRPEKGPTARGLATAELFDPVTRTWKSVASLHAGRFAHAATLLSSGKVLVTGGQLDEHNLRFLTSAELYDPESNEWTTLPDMAQARAHHAQVRLANDRVLVAGGASFDMSGECDDSGYSDDGTACANSGLLEVSSAEIYEPVLGADAAEGAPFRRMPFPSMVLSRSRFPMALLGGGTLLVTSNGPVNKATETLTLSPDGERCEQSYECRTGFCVEGVCCPSACDSACSACSAANGSPSDGVCSERSCDGHLSCSRPTGSGPVCFSECQSADQCEVGYACDPSSRTCVEPHSTFVSEGCSVGEMGAPSSDRRSWVGALLLSLLALITWRARRGRGAPSSYGARRAFFVRRAQRRDSVPQRRPCAQRRASLALLGLLGLGCDTSEEAAVCAPFAQCGDTCVNTRADRQSCGACGVACGPSELCLDGECALACAGGTSKCGDRCVDLSVDPENCGACGEACAESYVCDEGACALPGGIRSYIFPGVHAAGGVRAKEPMFLLAADEPATIYYTTDGSIPVPGQPGTQSGRSPLAVPPTDAEGVSQRRIQWFADYDLLGPEAEIHSYLSVTDPQAETSFGGLVQPPELSPDGAPLIVVAPGADVSGFAEYEQWISQSKGYCPLCYVQLYIGIKDMPETLACNNLAPSGPTYPGQQGTFSFQGKAPLTPGRYAIRSWLTLDYNCSPDRAASGINDEVGLIIVQ